MPENRSRVVVRGSDIRKPPLLDSTEPQVIEMYDVDNQLVAFLVRIFTDSTWGLCTKHDPDWPEMCVRYGFSTLRNVPLQNVIRDGVRPFIQGT
jgi:hypothetical protein